MHFPSARTSSLLLVMLCIAGCERKPSTATRTSHATPVRDVGAPAQATSNTPPAAGVPKVAFLGDSISAGLHLPAEQAFPAVIQRRLAARNVPMELVNAGVSGDTTAGGLRRVDWLLKQRPDVVVIELGANDGLRGVAPETIKQNLRAIVSKVRAAGAQPLLLGMRLPPSYGATYTREFEAIYADLARELSVPLVPFFMEGVAGVPELNLEDGLHPTKEGHERLAANVADRLLTVLKELDEEADASVVAPRD